MKITLLDKEFERIDLPAADEYQEYGHLCKIQPDSTQRGCGCYFFTKGKTTCITYSVSHYKSKEDAYCRITGMFNQILSENKIDSEDVLVCIGDYPETPSFLDYFKRGLDINNYAYA